jgi:hypothetical protein
VIAQDSAVYRGRIQSAEELAGFPTSGALGAGGQTITKVFGSTIADPTLALEMRFSVKSQSYESRAQSITYAWHMSYG